MKYISEPEISCPEFDEAIKQIEKARSINNELRQWGQQWQDNYEELELDSQKEIETLQEEKQDLENEMDELKGTIKEQEKRIEDMEEEIRNLNCA